MAHAMKRTAAIALAAGLAIPGTIGTAVVLNTAPAFAQSIDTVNEATGSITVHKRTNHSELGSDHDGSDLGTGAPGEPLNGAQFSLQPLQLITDDATFAAAAGFKVSGETVVDADGNTVTPGAAQTGTTEGEGTVTFGDLAAGAYLLTETAAPASTDTVYIPAAPMIVYVPIANNDEWNRDVHVYPKNTELKTTKKVVDKDRQPVAGDKIDYTIDTNAPVMPQGRTLTEFSLNDYYNNKELLNPEIGALTLNGTALAEGTDYTVSTDAYTAGDKGDANTKTSFVFTEAGLQKLTDSKGGAIQVTIKAEVAKTVVKGGEGLDDGAVDNYADTTGATKRTDDSTTVDEPFKTPEEKVTSYFGAVRVVKKGEDGKVLEGAKFELHKVSSDATCDGVKAGADTKIETGDLVTDSNGKLFINNLHVTDVANSTETIDDTYCLVETEAPSGYQKLTAAIPFTLTAGEVTAATADDQVTTEVYNISKDVENTKRPEFSLPQTGGMGVVALVLAGLAILGGGAFAARRQNA